MYASWKFQHDPSNSLRYMTKCNVGCKTDSEPKNILLREESNWRKLGPERVNGNSLQSSVIYQATTKRHDTSETYKGLTENDFKTRYRNHIASFCLAKHRNSIELSKHIWALKDSNIDHSISWHIISSHSSYNSSSKRCNLCLREKLLIICGPDLLSLNKRNELVFSCHHRNKGLLCNN